jgi:hypothetical protein
MAKKPIKQYATLTDDSGADALSVATGGAVTVGADADNIRNVMKRANIRTPGYSMTMTAISSSLVRAYSNAYTGTDVSSAGAYLVSICWNDNAVGSINYRNTITGIVSIVNGYNGSAVTRYAYWTSLSVNMRAGGPSAPTITVDFETATGATGIPFSTSERWNVALNGANIAASFGEYQATCIRLN